MAAALQVAQLVFYVRPPKFTPLFALRSIPPNTIEPRRLMCIRTYFLPGLEACLTLYKFSSYLV